MADNLYAGSSVQVYVDSDEWPNLEHTHEDASGFLDYVAHFNALNFRLKDDDVVKWRFDPAFAYRLTYPLSPPTRDVLSKIA